MPFVFISYSHRDRAVVQDVVRVIRQGGFDVWLDVEQLRSDVDFNRQITDALQAANFVVACLSASMMSDIGYVFLEHGSFRKRSVEDRKSIIPLRLNDCALPSDLVACHEAITWRNGDGGPKLLAALNGLRPSEQTWISRLRSRFTGLAKESGSPGKEVDLPPVVDEGPVTIVLNEVFVDILGSSATVWKATYQAKPSIDEVLSDLRLVYPFAIVNTDAERSAYLTSKILDALSTIIGSPSPSSLFLRFLSQTGIDTASPDGLKRLLLHVGQRSLEALRANETQTASFELRKGSVSHFLAFFIRPASFALLSERVAEDHLTNMDALVGGLSKRVRDQRGTTGNVCVIDLFLTLLTNSHAIVEATLSFFQSPEESVRAAQPADLNRIVLCPDLVSEKAARVLNMDAAELKERMTFRAD